MSQRNHIDGLISHWPTRKALAEEIGASAEVVHKWARSGRIPTDWQASVIAAAAARGIDYATPEWMVRVHSREAQKASEVAP